MKEDNFWRSCQLTYDEFCKVMDELFHKRVITKNLHEDLTYGEFCKLIHELANTNVASAMQLRKKYQDFTLKEIRSRKKDEVK